MELSPDGVGVDDGVAVAVSVGVDDGAAVAVSVGVDDDVGEGIIHEGLVKVSVGVDERGSAAFACSSTLWM